MAYMECLGYVLLSFLVDRKGNRSTTAHPGGFRHCSCLLSVSGQTYDQDLSQGLPKRCFRKSAWAIVSTAEKPCQVLNRTNNPMPILHLPRLLNRSFWMVYSIPIQSSLQSWKHGFFSKDVQGPHQQPEGSFFSSNTFKNTQPTLAEHSDRSREIGRGFSSIVGTWPPEVASMNPTRSGPGLVWSVA